MNRREFIGTIVGTAVAAVAMPKTTIKVPYGDFLERIRLKMIEAKRSGINFDPISIDSPVELSGIHYRKVHLHLGGRWDVQWFEPCRCAYAVAEPRDDSSTCSLFSPSQKKGWLLL